MSDRGPAAPRTGPAGTRLLKAGDVVGVRHRVAAQAAVVEEQRALRQGQVDAAFAAGYDEGRRSALAEGAAAALRGADALDQLAVLASEAHSAEVTTTSRAVLAAALDVAEWILRHELARDSRSLLTRLGEGAAALLPSPTTRIGVSAADAPAVRAWAVGRSGVEVHVDPARSPGDASLDTDAGSVDVSVAAALRIAAETLGVDPARGVE